MRAYDIQAKCYGGNVDEDGNPIEPGSEIPVEHRNARRLAEIDILPIDVVNGEYAMNKAMGGGKPKIVELMMSLQEAGACGPRGCVETGPEGEMGVKVSPGAAVGLKGGRGAGRGHSGHMRKDPGAMAEMAHEMIGQMLDGRGAQESDSRDITGSGDVDMRDLARMDMADGLTPEIDDIIKMKMMQKMIGGGGRGDLDEGRVGRGLGIPVPARMLLDELL